MKFFWVAVVGIVALGVQGCSTNRLGDPKKTKYIEHLSDQGENIMEQINQVQTEKERAALALKKQLLALQQRIKQEYGEQNIQMKEVQEGWQVTILDQILFRPGSADINQSGTAVLEKVASSIAPVIPK